MRYLALLLIFVLPASAQEISVTVQDPYSLEDIPGASVTLLRAGQEIESGVTDINGQISFGVTVVNTEDLPTGSFNLQAPFPNPSRGITNIPMYVEHAGIMEVDVLDVLGRIVATRAVSTGSGAQALRLQLGSIAPGTYFARVRQGGRVSATEAIILTQSTGGVVEASLGGGGSVPVARKTSSDPNQYDVRIEQVGYLPTTRSAHAVKSPVLEVSLLKGITNTIGMELIRIPAGTFQMGSENGGSNERPVHSVTLSADFWLGTYEVTQAEYVAVVGSNPSRWQEDNRLPVERVKWLKAIAFANTLSEAEGLPPCYDADGNVVGGGVYACTGYRLPTEAEWEYATRAGTTTAYSFGDDPEELNAYAWHSNISDARTHPVGEKLSNRWGLYDVHGNLSEWIHDWYDEDYYASSPGTDPAGPSSGMARVRRGGSWWNLASSLRSADRRADWPTNRGIGEIGLRLARTAN